MKKYNYALIVTALIAAISVALYVLYAQNNFPTAQPQSSPQTSNNSSTQDTDKPDTSQPTTYPVSVFFSKHPQSDDDPSATFAVSRVSPDSGVGKFAITELLKGPTAAEKSQGYFSTVALRSGTSTCDGNDFKLTIGSGVATLQFCKPFDHLGVVADGQADSTIKATLNNFFTVQKVIILNSNGDCEFDLSGMNLCKE